MKNIYETLAALGAGAILLSGCGSAAEPAKSPDVPAAVETTPAKEGEAKQEAASDASEQPTDATVAIPAEASAPAASGTASAAPAAKKAPVKSGTAKKAGTAKKKDAAGSCGEGTCA